MIENDFSKYIIAKSVRLFTKQIASHKAFQISIERPQRKT